MSYQSNLPAVTRQLTEARRAGLIAAAQVLRSKVVLGLRGGFTSGKYVTGNLTSSVTISEPIVRPSGGEIRVGTNVKYAVWWELGHDAWPVYYSKKLKRFVAFDGPKTHRRKEVWMPAFRDSVDRQRAAYLRAFNRVMETVGASRDVSLGGVLENNLPLPDNIVLGDN